MTSSRKVRWKIGLVAFGFWLLMMGLLLHRELGVKRLPRTSAHPEGDVAGQRHAEPRETLMGLFLDGDRVGNLQVRQQGEPRYGQAGVAMELDLGAALNLLGKKTDLELTGSVWRSLEVARADFEFAVRSAGRGGGPYDFRISGEVARGWLEAEILSAGEALPLRVPIDEELVFSSGFGTALEFPSLAVGEEVRLESFDPLTFQKSPMRVRCVAEEVLQIAGERVAARRLEVTAGAVGSVAWIDELGDVVQVQTPFGLMLRRVETLADPAPADGGGSGELLRLTAVVPRGERPFRGARTSVFRITGAAPRPLPEDRVQEALGEGRYRLTTPPEPRATAPGEEPAMLAPYLAADAFVQSDHPRILRQASAIVGEESDPWGRALKIHQWVYETLEKQVVVSIPSALEVLEKGRGDCNEHTVLFAALARAAALPTRIAIGLVWSDELGGFYYHAWPEVHVGDWVWMDPTLGQPVADATHVKLLNGGIERWTGLLAYLGQLEIEVLEIR